jgi:enoyl-CoA hydratase
VGLITLNRPTALNALNSAPIEVLNHGLSVWDKGPAIGCVVITRSKKALAAGVAIKEMEDKTVTHAYLSNFLASWDRVADVRKPMIAAVSGLSLGDGCELGRDVRHHRR